MRDAVAAASAGRPDLDPLLEHLPQPGVAGAHLRVVHAHVALQVVRPQVQVRAVLAEGALVV
jgi:hypothetical protein